jgi:hypothetical protein
LGEGRRGWGRGEGSRGRIEGVEGGEKGMGGGEKGVGRGEKGVAGDENSLIQCAAPSLSNIIHPQTNGLIIYNLANNYA